MSSIEQSVASKISPDDRVITFAAWCEACGFSPATGRRLIAAGDGPVITRLSDRRIGIRGRDHVEWLNRRASTAPTA
jgi:predicted DNA-binding transcriptional regulator AlpA